MKFLHRNKIGRNTKLLCKSDYYVLDYEQLLMVNGAGSTPSSTTSTPSTSHYGRNDNNTNVPQTKADAEKEVAKGTFLKMSESEDIYHEQGTSNNYNPKNNDKYVSADGHIEVVYNEKGEIVTDYVNQGTYNYADPNTDKLGHVVKDVIPYIFLGNSPKDPTYTYERVFGTYSGDVNTTKAERTAADREHIMNTYYEHH